MQPHLKLHFFPSLEHYSAPKSGDFVFKKHFSFLAFEANSAAFLNSYLFSDFCPLCDNDFSWPADVNFISFDFDVAKL